jgi:hypothetical protein
MAFALFLNGQVAHVYKSSKRTGCTCWPGAYLEDGATYFLTAIRPYKFRFWQAVTLVDLFKSFFIEPGKN